MDEMLQEIVSSRGVAMRVDREHGVIRGVKLLGLVSRNGRRYLPAALQQAAGLYEGAKVNVNHPKGHPLAARDYQDRLGSIRGVQIRGEGLFGDLHYNPKHALAEQLAWDAAHAPENVGLSHNVEARTTRRDGQIVVESILKVQSVDLVADPATTRGLYESAAVEPVDGPLADVTLDELRAVIEAARADLQAEVTALRAELDELRVREEVHRRRVKAQRLLREFGLPDPEPATSHAGPLVSQVFFESLLAAPDEAAMRALVQERAQVIGAARRLPAATFDRARPLSREQQRCEQPSPAPCDARAFALAIT
jgi:hypothetical protein